MAVHLMGSTWVQGLCHFCMLYRPVHVLSYLISAVAANKYIIDLGLLIFPLDFHFGYLFPFFLVTRSFTSCREPSKEWNVYFELRA